MASKGSKTTKIVRSTVKEARRDIAQVGKTAAAASKAVRAVAKVFIKPAPARELSQINKLLGEEFTSLRSARAALKQQSKPAKPVKGYTLPAGVVIKRPAAAPPAPPPVLPLPKPPGKPGESIFSTRQLPGGITQDDVTRGLMELGEEGLAQKMDALLRPGEQWCFFIQNPATGHFFRSGVLYPSWSAMVRDIRGRYKDLGPNAMQALKFLKVGGGEAPQRRLSDDEYEALLRRHKTATQEARAEQKKINEERLKQYRQEMAKRNLYFGTTQAETIKSFGQVFEREERLQKAAAEQRAAERKQRRAEQARERRATQKAERAAAEARKQAGISKRKETMARKREAAEKAARAAERKAAAAAKKRQAAKIQKQTAEIKRLKQKIKQMRQKGTKRRK